MMAERSSFATGALVGTLCMAGVFAMLQSSSTTTLYTVPSTAVSSQTTVVPTVVPAVSQVAVRAALETAPMGAEEAPVEFATPEFQGNSWTTVLAGIMAVPLAAAGFFMVKNRPVEEERKVLVSIDDLMNVGKQALVAGAVVSASAAMADVASAYPIFAQQGFSNPREATGRIVCANCHLAQKETEIELPQAVLPDQVFEAVAKIPYSGGSAVSQAVADPSSLLAQDVVGTVAFRGGQPVEFTQEAGIPVSQSLVEFNAPSTPNTVFKATIKVPYDKSLKQVGAKGKPADLNVGAVVILPEGFTLAPPERVPEKLKEEMNGLQFIQYAPDKPNILVVGPVPGKLYEELVLPILSPDPATNKNVHFGSLPVYVGGNRGRGQLYPTGEKSNNNAYTVAHAGKIADIELDAKKKIYSIAIEEANGLISNEELPPGAELLVKKGDVVELGQAITTNPNVGGFGQAESEIVLQDPNRVLGLIVLTTVTIANQTMLVIKKKQWEQVQAAEM